MTATMRGLFSLARPKGRFDPSLAHPRARLERRLARVAILSAPLLSVLALATAHPSPAAAQVTTTSSTNQAIDSNLVVKRNGSIIKNGTLVYGNVADCGGENFPAAGSTKPSSFEFSVTYTAGAPVVEAWLGVGTSENCATAANRMRGGNGTLPPVCTFLGTVTNNGRNPVITVPGNQLFNQTTGRANPSDATDVSQLPCDAVSGGQTYTVYLLPLPNSTTNVNAQEPITVGVLSTLKAVFTPYTRRPDAPANLSGRSGESEVGVSFKAPSSSMTLTKYKGYFDVTGGAGTGGKGLGVGTDADAGSDAGMDAGSDASIDASAEAGSAVAGDGGPVADSGAGSDGGLASGMDAAVVTTVPSSASDAGAGVLTCGSGYLENNPVPLFNLPTTVLRESSTSSSTSVNLTDMTNIPVGTQIAVAAVAIDPAGNESKLSTPICVQRVNTVGFLDACDQTPGCREGLNSCSLRPGQRGSAWELSILGLALAVLIRRRRRA